jgi:hypothetical protein
MTPTEEQSAIIALAVKTARERMRERCAQVVDQCNREGPYNAIGAASRIRALELEE